MKEARYFYVPLAETSNELPEQEAQHAIKVLRLTEGSVIYLMDGEGCFYEAEVTMSSKKRCFYAIRKRLPQQKTWHGYIHLAIAPTKMMERMEWMVEKSVEIGVDEITFLDCQFSERHTLRIERVEKIVVAAMKQSRKPYKTIINGMTPFDNFVAHSPQGRKYIAHCYEEIERKDLFHELQSLDPEESVTVLVGPEGDFSIDEVKLAIDHGFDPISLGNSRLRTETAGMMAIARSQMLKRV